VFKNIRNLKKKRVSFSEATKYILDFSIQCLSVQTILKLCIKTIYKLGIKLSYTFTETTLVT